MVLTRVFLFSEHRSCLALVRVLWSMGQRILKVKRLRLLVIKWGSCLDPSIRPTPERTFPFFLPQVRPNELSGQ